MSVHSYVRDYRRLSPGDNDNLYQKLDFTTIDDTARYTVAALCDTSGTGHRDVLVVGDSVSPNELTTILSEVTGETVRAERLGSIDELRALAEEKKRTASNPWDYLAPQYMWTMMSGRGKLDPVMNDQFPGIRPTSVRDFLAQALSG